MITRHVINGCLPPTPSAICFRLLFLKENALQNIIFVISLISRGRWGQSSKTAIYKLPREHFHLKIELSKSVWPVKAVQPCKDVILISFLKECTVKGGF